MSDKAVCLLASPSAEHVSSLPPRLSRLTSSPTSRENSYFDGWPHRHGMTRSLLYSTLSRVRRQSLWGSPSGTLFAPSSRTDPSFPSLATAAANDPKRPLLSPPFRRRRKTEPPSPSSLPSHMSSARGVYLHSANRKTPIWL